jgi:hypothetical protein
MSKPVIIIHNSETNEIVEREMTDAEFLIYQDSIGARKLTEEEVTAQNKRAEILSKLGLTADDLKALGL